MPLRIETPRMILRTWTHDDAPALLEAVETSRDTLLPWLPWASTENRSIGECHFNIERFIRQQQSAMPEYIVLGFFDRATGRALGGGGWHHITPALHEAEIGYWMRADARRLGLCAEAVAHELSLCLRPQDQGGWGFRRMTIYCGGSNVGSRRVCEKLGLRKEVERKQNYWVDTLGWQDSMGWAVLAHEWDTARHAVRG